MTGGGMKHGTRSKALVMYLQLLVLLLLAIIQITGVLQVAASKSLDSGNEELCSWKDPAMDPTHEMRYGHDVVWQIPPEPKAVLLLAHGLGMDSLQYFDPGPNCKQCYGMPESRKAVLESLQRQYAVISVTVLDEDWQVLSTIVKEWMANYSLDSLPLVAWGMSAGTATVTALTRGLSMRAIVLMCGDGILEVEAMATPLTFPPTFFAYMPRDALIPEMNHTHLVEEAMATLTAQGVTVSDTQCWPKPKSPLSFTQRIRCISEEISQIIYAALEAAGWLDSGGYVLKNPAVGDLESVLVEANALPYCAVTSGDRCLRAHVKQALKTAYAAHSFTNDANDVVFAWLDSHILSPALTASI
ncbi:unnamed protein product [Calypogeia fissa]